MFQESDEDKASLRHLLELAAGEWPRLDDIAERLGVARSTVSMWLSGDRSTPWAAVRGALRRTARRYPLVVPRLVEALAAELLDAKGRWIPAGEGGGSGSWERESSEQASAMGDLHRAMRDGDAEQIEAAAHDALRETQEAVVVALGTAAARKPAQLRVRGC